MILTNWIEIKFLVGLANGVALPISMAGTGNEITHKKFNRL